MDINKAVAWAMQTAQITQRDAMAISGHKGEARFHLCPHGGRAWVYNDDGIWMYDTLEEFLRAVRAINEGEAHGRQAQKDPHRALQESASPSGGPG